MTVKLDLHLCLLSVREAGRGFIVSLRAAGRTSQSYHKSLETTLGLLADYAEESGRPDLERLTTAHIEEYLIFLRNRPEFFGLRKTQEKVSESYVEVQYRRLSTFFDYAVSRDYMDRNPLALIPHPKVPVRTIPTVPLRVAQDLLAITDHRHFHAKQEKFLAMRNRAMVMML